MLLLFIGITLLLVYTYNYFVGDKTKVYKEGSYYLVDDSYNRPDKIDIIEEEYYIRSERHDNFIELEFKQKL